MIKQTILVCFVALFAYYAGAKGLTLGKVLDWFNERKVTQTIEDVFNKTVEIAKKNELAKKSEGVIDSFKE